MASRRRPSGSEAAAAAVAEAASESEAMAGACSLPEWRPAACKRASRLLLSDAALVPAPGWERCPFEVGRVGRRTLTGGRMD